MSIRTPNEIVKNICLGLESLPIMMHESWKEVLCEELKAPYFKELTSFVQKERESKKVYPPEDKVFSALNETPFNDVKVVIMGQDPYHGFGQAHGLSFSVPEGIKIPPSLKNIFLELSSDLEIEKPTNGCLISWAQQGVLLLNATLTVREKEPQSHYGMGWERFTDAIIKKLVEKKDPIVFVLWGKAAQEKCAHFLQEERHLVLIAPHPSPFSAYNGFFGCRHFSKINKFLEEQGKPPIHWQTNLELVATREYNFA